MGSGNWRSQSRCWWEKLLLGLLLLSMQVVNVSSESLFTRRLAQAASENDSLVCQLCINSILPPSGRVSIHDEQDGQFTTCSPWTTGEATQGAYQLDTPAWILSHYQSQLKQGLPVFLMIPHGFITRDTIVIPEPETVEVISDDVQHRLQRRRKLKQSVAKKTVMLRIRGLDSEPDFSISQLTSYLLTHQLSARRQLERCSHGLVTLDASRYGVLDVPINVNIQGLTNLEVMNLAEKYVNGVVLANDNQVDNIRAWADFLLFVIPPGTGGWAAFATVSGKQSVYNNRWGGYLGGLLHEMGHNLGLDHAFEDGKEYEGTTGFMGDVPMQILAPRRCYNAHNHYLLSWYQDRTLEVDPSVSQLLTLVPFVQYDDSAPGEHIIAHLGDMYMQYNRAVGYNAESGEKRDELVIVRDNGYAQGTELLVGLDVGEDYHENDGQGEITVHVCNRIDGGGVYGTDVLLVSVGYGPTLCSYNIPSPSGPNPSPSVPQSPSSPQTPSLSPLTPLPPSSPDFDVPTEATFAPTIIVGDVGNPNEVKGSPITTSEKSGTVGIVGASLGMAVAVLFALFVYFRYCRTTRLGKPTDFIYIEKPKKTGKRSKNASMHSAKSDTSSSSDEVFADEFALSPPRNLTFSLPVCEDGRSFALSIDSASCGVPSSIYGEDVDQGLANVKERMRGSINMSSHSTRNYRLGTTAAVPPPPTDLESLAVAQRSETCWGDWFDTSHWMTNNRRKSGEASSSFDFLTNMCGYGTNRIESSTQQ